MQHNVALWLRQGVSPRRLALTLALGFAIGCIPIIGIPTVVCTALAVALRLNMPAIQAANYVAMPFQIALIVPFVRLGWWLFPFGPRPTMNAGALRHASFWSMHLGSPATLLTQLGSLAGHAMLAWLVLAIPTILLLTMSLTILLRRIPALSGQRLKA
jgi:uncharacterized protein (DUF2062 family)